MLWKVPDQGKAVGVVVPPSTRRRTRGYALLHLLCSAAREVQQEHALGFGAVQDQFGDPVRQRVGFAGAGAGNHQERSQVWLGFGAVVHGLALGRIQVGELVEAPGGRGNGLGRRVGTDGRGQHPRTVF